MKEDLDPKKKTILVVDDEKPIKDILVYNLKKEGYNTLEATDGEMGLNIAIEQRPDLILLDVMLPKMDGLTVCKRVKQTYQIGLQNTFLFPCTKILGNKTGTGCIKSSHHIIYKRICFCSGRVSFYKNMVKGIDTALHKQIGEGK